MGSLELTCLAGIRIDLLLINLLVTRQPPDWREAERAEPDHRAPEARNPASARGHRGPGETRRQQTWLAHAATTPAYANLMLFFFSFLSLTEFLEHFFIN